MCRYIIAIILFLAIPIIGQPYCDVNGDGIYDSLADLMMILNILNSPDEYYMCEVDCDPDQDGNPLTVSDILILVNYLYNPGIEFNPDFSRHPGSDTLIIESTSALPGDQISLPIYLKTIDTLTAYQFYVVADTAYIALDSISLNVDMDLHQAYSIGSIHCFYLNYDNPGDSICLLPGVYYLGDLITTVNSDIVDPITTQIEFSGCPEDNFYTGFANLTFFQPVLVNSEIQITPVGIDRDGITNLPTLTTIKAYPNPFNSSVRIKATCLIESELVIYDLLGRAVKTFPVFCGKNSFTWDATDDNGKSVGTGIYFVRVKGSATSKVEKILFLK